MRNHLTNIKNKTLQNAKYAEHHTKEMILKNSRTKYYYKRLENFNLFCLLKDKNCHEKCTFILSKVLKNDPLICQR